MMLKDSVTYTLLEKHRMIDGTVPVYFFVEEVPIKRSLRVLNIDSRKRQIEWGNNSQSKNLIDLTNELFIKDDRLSFYAPIVFKSEKFFITTFFDGNVTFKFQRKSIRVKTAKTRPVILTIGQNIYVVEDISETGFSFLVPEEQMEFFQIGSEVSGVLSLYTNDDNIHFRVVRHETFNSNDVKLGGIPFTKVGSMFLTLSPYLQNLIVKYVIERQKDIARKVKFLK